MIDKDKGDVATCTYCGRTTHKESRACPRCGNVFSKGGAEEKEVR